VNIEMIGSGHIGGTLGKAWAAKGHRVTFGSRDPQSERMRALLESIGPNAAAASALRTGYRPGANVPDVRDELVQLYVQIQADDGQNVYRIPQQIEERP
jgi:tRNA A37 threonylcarbamoyladenosine synthetase subunit TsaC/SUA5/YrdC